MSLKRVFKFKTFDRWAKNVLADQELLRAAEEIQRGEFEADLGDGVCKKRVAMPGHGKSGSTRLLVAHSNAFAVFFLAGRKKSDPGTDFTPKEIIAVKIVAKGVQRMDVDQLEDLIRSGAMKEIFE